MTDWREPDDMPPEPRHVDLDITVVRRHQVWATTDGHLRIEGPGGVVTITADSIDAWCEIIHETAQAVAAWHALPRDVGAQLNLEAVL